MRGEGRAGHGAIRVIAYHDGDSDGAQGSDAISAQADVLDVGGAHTMGCESITIASPTHLEPRAHSLEVHTRPCVTCALRWALSRPGRTSEVALVE